MDWDSTTITYITFEVITGFVTVIGNSIVLIAILRTTSLHTVTNVFIGNLAVADIFVGLFVAPLAALSFLGVPRDVYGCIFINSAIVMLTNISVLMLLAVAVERFIAIRLPYAYKRLLTIRRALMLNGCIWTFGTIPGLVPMFGWNIAPDELSSCSFVGVIPMEYMVYFQFFGFIIVPIFAMFIIYIYIWQVIRQHMKQRDVFQRMFSKDRRSRNQWNKDVRAAKFFAVLIALFGLFWLPVNILNCFTLFCPDCYQPLRLLLAAIVMSHANSSINPFLYAASNSRIQRAIMSLLRIGNLAPRSPDETTVKASTVAPELGVSTISNNYNDNGNSEGQSDPQSILNLDLKENTHHESNSPTKPMRSSIKVRDSNDETFDTIQAQNSGNTRINGRKNSVLIRSDDLIPFPGYQKKNDTFSPSFYKAKYIPEGIQHDVPDGQSTRLDPPTAHKRPPGRVNFAYIDDDGDNSSRTSSLQSLNVTDNARSNFNSKEIEISHHQFESKEHYQREAGDSTVSFETEKTTELQSKEDLTTNTHSLEGVTTQQNRQNVGEHEVLDIKRRTGKRYGHLFDMENESLQEQECSKIICVNENTDNKGMEDRPQDNASRNNRALHSYFSPQAMKGGTNMAEVETNVIIIGTELHHTKL